LHFIFECWATENLKIEKLDFSTKSK